VRGEVLQHPVRRRIGQTKHGRELDATMRAGAAKRSFIPSAAAPQWPRRVRRRKSTLVTTPASHPTIAAARMIQTSD
jgi:hypothetical protein